MSNEPKPSSNRKLIVALVAGLFAMGALWALGQVVPLR